MQRYPVGFFDASFVFLCAWLAFDAEVSKWIETHVKKLPCDALDTLSLQLLNVSSGSALLQFTAMRRHLKGRFVRGVHTLPSRGRTAPKNI